MTDDDALKAPRRKRDERLRKRQERDQKVISIFARTGALPVDGLGFRRQLERAEWEQSRGAITPL
jgi:hypothetical protein